MTNFIACIAIFMACFSFCFIHNIRRKAMFFAPLGAVVTWLGMILLEGVVSAPVQVLGATILGALYSEFMARYQKEPVTAYLFLSIYPTVPGGGIYYTMEYCISNNIPMFLKEGVETFVTAGMIATGIMLVSTNIKLYNNIVLARTHPKSEGKT